MHAALKKRNATRGNGCVPASNNTRLTGKLEPIKKTEVITVALNRVLLVAFVFNGTIRFAFIAIY